MIKCPFCGYNNEDGALFCEQCKSDLSNISAADLPPVDAKLSCSACSETILLDPVVPVVAAEPPILAPPPLPPAPLPPQEKSPIIRDQDHMNL